MVSFLKPNARLWAVRRRPVRACSPSSTRASCSTSAPTSTPRSTLSGAPRKSTTTTPSSTASGPTASSVVPERVSSTFLRSLFHGLHKFSVSEKPCNHDSLGSKVGKCVNPLVPGSVPTWRNPSTYLLQNVSSNLAAAPRCGTKEKNRIQDYEFTCRCSNRTKVASNGQTQGNCIR